MKVMVCHVERVSEGKTRQLWSSSVCLCLCCVEHEAVVVMIALDSAREQERLMRRVDVLT